MTSLDWIYLAAVAVLLLWSGLFSSAEIGLLSVNRFRVHQMVEEDDARARTLEHLLGQSTRVLTAILILITTLNYANESLMTYWLHHKLYLPEWVPFVVLLIAVLIFAEITPISYAAANPEIVATRLARLLAFVTRALSPIINLIAAIANGVVRLLGGEAKPRPLVTGEEVLTIVDLETERGVLEEEEKELIHSIFEFSETVVREIMVPRIDIIAVPKDATIVETLELAIEHQFSRMPVFHGSLDHILGFVYVKDLLPYQFRHETAETIRHLVRPATFIPETKLVSELLNDFRRTKQTVAMVLDEYGGTAGLVTVEDLLEEIVGEIYDEYDTEQKPVEWVDARTLVVDGKVPVDEVEELIDHELPRGEYDTIGGLLYNHFGDVPNRGESMTVDDILIIVDRLDGHRIAKVRILLPEPPATREVAE